MFLLLVPVWFRNFARCSCMALDKCCLSRRGAVTDEIFYIVKYLQGMGKHTDENLSKPPKFQISEV